MKLVQICVKLTKAVKQHRIKEDSSGDQDRMKTGKGDSWAF